jgi:hypothetical protein
MPGAGSEVIRNRGSNRPKLLLGNTREDRKEQAVASMTVRRRRQHPPDFGRASTFVETIDLPVLASLSERFLREIDYYGLVEIEYKLDCRDGDTSCSMSTLALGATTARPSCWGDFRPLLFADQAGTSGRLVPRASWSTMDQTRDRPPDRACRNSKW